MILHNSRVLGISKTSASHSVIQRSGKREKGVGFYCSIKMPRYV